jgi:hypothetical protein
MVDKIDVNKPLFTKFKTLAKDSKIFYNVELYYSNKFSINSYEN